MSMSSAVSAGTLGLLLLAAGTATAQSSSPAARRWEVRATGGAFVPAGEQRKVLGDAHLSAAQLSWLVRPSLAVTGTFGWARSRDLTLTDSPRLDVFTTDLGLEARPLRWVTGRTVTISPFIGAGVGARSYNHRALDRDATHNVAAYGAAGGELGVGRVGLRLEVRDYASGFKPLGASGASATRNDLMMLVGLRFNRHRTIPRR